MPRTLKSPTILDVTQAAARIRPYIIRTVLQHYPVLDKLIGAEVYVKHENHQRLGSFKIRGALNVLLRISEKDRTVITASTGNQGKAIAYAANQFGLNAAIAVRIFLSNDYNFPHVLVLH
jgi:threonine dehydratase